MRKPIQMWVDALRSGEYKQGKGVLHAKTKRGDRFCCLGVACDLYQKHGPGDLIVTERISHDLSKDYVNYKYDDQTGHLPEKVKEWLGVDSSFQYELIDMNDGTYHEQCKGKATSRRFPTIANHIEAKHAS